VRPAARGDARGAPGRAGAGGAEAEAEAEAEGEVWVGGVGVMRGYLDLVAPGRRSCRQEKGEKGSGRGALPAAPPAAERVLATGDRGRSGAGGRVALLGRGGGGARLKVLGAAVAAEAVEARLCAFRPRGGGACARAAAVGVSRGGVLFALLAGGADDDACNGESGNGSKDAVVRGEEEADLVAWCARALPAPPRPRAPPARPAHPRPLPPPGRALRATAVTLALWSQRHACPMGFARVARLPATASGKTDRAALPAAWHALRARGAAGADADAGAAARARGAGARLAARVGRAWEHYLSLSGATGGAGGGVVGGGDERLFVAEGGSSLGAAALAAALAEMAAPPAARGEGAAAGMRDRCVPGAAAAPCAPPGPAHASAASAAGCWWRC